MAIGTASRSANGIQLRLGYRPALDGIRAVAILAVLGFHATSHLKGGYIGVDIFFVLSGFLITALLVQEWRASGRIDLADFYGRRARRLLPALFLTVLGVGIAVSIDPSLNDRGLPFWQEAGAAIFYASNWVVSFAADPIRVLGLLDHTWSLAIEEQFYIVWPLLLVLLLRGRWPFGRLTALAAGMAAASALLRAALWNTHLGSNVYNRTDTRADGLLLGCALALALSTRRGQTILARVLTNLAPPLVATAFLLVFALKVSVDDFALSVGLALVVLASAAVIGHSIVAENSPLTRMLALRPLAWIGARSYGMYLFHIPIFAVISSTSLGNRTPIATIPLKIAVTMLAAAASYRWFESRFLRRKRVPGAPPHVQRADSVQPDPQIGAIDPSRVTEGGHGEPDVRESRSVGSAPGGLGSQSVSLRREEG